MSDLALDGVLDVISTEEPTLHDKVAPVKQTVETKTTETNTAEAPKSEPKQETKTDVASEDGDEEVVDTQDFSRSQPETEPEEETATEPLKTETSTEAETPVDTWEPTLPTPPTFNLPAPHVNEDGIIDNMTAEQYQTYMIERAKFEMRQEAFTQNVENQALEAAEKILPELRTNQAVRKMVENTRVASILNGEQINSFEAAKIVKEALGLTSTKLAEAKAAGAQSAKASITIQKNAAIETTGSTKTKPAPKNDNLAKRLKQGDQDAFVELMDNWDKEGKLS